MEPCVCIVRLCESMRSNWNRMEQTRESFQKRLTPSLAQNLYHNFFGLKLDFSERSLCPDYGDIRIYLGQHLVPEIWAPKVEKNAILGDF